MANDIAYGFMTLQDRFQDRVEDVGIEVVSSVMEASFREHDREITAVLDFFSQPTTSRAELVRLPGTRIAQPLADGANPEPTRITGSYEAGYPLRGYGDAYGMNMVERAYQTVQDANDWTMEQMKGDLLRMRREILKATIHNAGTAGWTFTDQPNAADPSVVVRSLANGDTIKYVKTGGTNETDSHFLAGTAAIGTASTVFQTIFDELSEHPSNNIAMNGYVLTFVPTNQKSAVEAHNLIKEPTNTLTIPGISSDRLLDNPQGLIPFGNQVLGEIDGNLIIEWKALPDDVILSVAPMASSKPLKRREHEAANLRGMRTYLTDVDGNNVQFNWRRWLGFGVSNRVSIVMYNVGNATYTNPTGYDPRSAA